MERITLDKIKKIAKKTGLFVKTVISNTNMAGAPLGNTASSIEKANSSNKN